MRVEAVALAILLALCAPAVQAQDEAPEGTPEAAEEESTGHRSPLIAAGWCVVSDGEEKAVADDNAETEEEEPAEPGCDAGLGIALYRWRRLAWVAVAGSETLGTGVAWISYQPKSGPVIAVALGLVARYGSRGIEPKVHLAIGATLSFGRRIAEE